MSLLINTYNDMVKEAEELVAKEVIAERVEVLNKYAELATELLNAEFPNNFEKSDVVELADRLIERDLMITNAQEKTAETQELLSEYVKVSRDLMAQEHGTSFTEADVEKLASTLFEMDLAEDFAKEAQAIVEYAFLDELNSGLGTEFTSLEEVKGLAKEADGMSQALTHVPGQGKSYFIPNTLGRVKAFAEKNPKLALGVGAAGLAATAFGAGRMSKHNKEAAFTEHGRINQEGRARGYNAMAKAHAESNAKYPGMALMKETYHYPMALKLLARRNAYAAQGKAQYARSFVPGVGMGSKGQKALERLDGGDK